MVKSNVKWKDSTECFVLQSSVSGIFGNFLKRNIQKSNELLKQQRALYFFFMNELRWRYPGRCMHGDRVNYYFLYSLNEQKKNVLFHRKTHLKCLVFPLPLRVVLLINNNLGHENVRIFIYLHGSIHLAMYFKINIIKLCVPYARLLYYYFL